MWVLSRVSLFTPIRCLMNSVCLIHNYFYHLRTGEFRLLLHVHSLCVSRTMPNTLNPMTQSSFCLQEYVIRIQRETHPEKCWHIKKRYRDFANLNGLLSMSGVTLPLPPKRLIGNMEPLFVAERQVGLQVCCSNCHFLNCIFLQNWV